MCILSSKYQVYSDTFHQFCKDKANMPYDKILSHFLGNRIFYVAKNGIKRQESTASRSGLLDRIG